METKTYTTIDRAAKGWPSGEWDGEPDKMQWQDEATGLPCLAVRNRSGAWCGYVGVAQGHPAFEQGYDELRRADGEWIEVHGGLTFAAFCQPHETEAEGICHLPGPGEPDRVWWLGFDCAHSGDCSPLEEKYAREKGYPFNSYFGETYKALGYVRRQCALLASQLAVQP